MKNQNATWSVLRKPDSPAFSLVYGYGYVAQDSGYDGQAVKEGWEVLVTGLQPEMAVRMRDIYKVAGKVKTATPDLSDILSYDMTQEVEDRDSSIASEFDLIEIEYQGRMIEGVITYHDEDMVEIDGFIEVSPAYFLKHATLIAKADSDCGFITEYGQYLKQLDENQKELFAYAAKAQSTLEYSEVA